MNSIRVGQVWTHKQSRKDFRVIREMDDNMYKIRSALAELTVTGQHIHAQYRLKTRTPNNA